MVFVGGGYLFVNITSLFILKVDWYKGSHFVNATLFHSLLCFVPMTVHDSQAFSWGAPRRSVDVPVTIAPPCVPNHKHSFSQIKEDLCLLLMSSHVCLPSLKLWRVKISSKTPIWRFKATNQSDTIIKKTTTQWSQRCHHLLLLERQVGIFDMTFA